MKLKRDLMENRVKKAKKELTKISHDHVRTRDSIKESHLLQGYCFDCGKLADSQNWQCGHWIPDSVGGALLRWHPYNMHGQASACNCGYNQEMVKIRYTLAMEAKYTKEQIATLLQLKQKTIKCDIIFLEKMIDLYTVGDEDKIVEYLECL